MKMLRFFVLMMLLSSPAFASSHLKQFSVGGGAGFTMTAPWAKPTYSSKVDPGLRGALWARFHDEQHLGWELSYDFLTMSTANIKANSLVMSFFWRYLIEEKIQPIVAIGLGDAKVTNYFLSGTADLAVLKVRLGVDIDIAPNLELAVYLDHFTIFKGPKEEPNAQVLSPMVGINYSFGSPASPPAAVKTIPAASAPAAKVQPTQEAAATTTAPKKESSVADTASNHSLNDLSKAGTQANLDVKFGSGNAKLLKGSHESLAALAKVLKSNPKMRVEIQGHTDNSGPEAKNKTLSLARANAVKNELMAKHKIAADRLKPVGYGSQVPLTSNSSAEGRALNRRVTIKVI